MVQVTYWAAINDPVLPKGEEYKRLIHEYRALLGNEPKLIHKLPESEAIAMLKRAVEEEEPLPFPTTD